MNNSLSYLSRCAFLLQLVLAGACGGSSPSAPAPTTSVQVGGQWRFAVRITSVTGGDCLNPLFASFVDRVYSQTLSLQQDGSALTGRVPATIYGVDCNLTGTATQNAISLSGSTCSPLGGSPAFPSIPVACPTGGELRITSPAVAASITMSGTSGTGTYSETFIVTSPTTGQQVSTMTVNGSVTMTRQ